MQERQSLFVLATKQNVFYSEDERIQAIYLEHFDT